MTLSRQILLVVWTACLAMFAGTFLITVDNTRDYLLAQLESHAQDAATSLGLTLSRHAEDVVMMESLVDAVFDRGHFKAIELAGTSGDSIIERNLSVEIHGVPDWFLRAVPLDVPSATAKVMAGWRQRGEVRVTSHPGHAYSELWSNTLETFGWSIVVLAAALLVTASLVRRVLAPLRAVEAQAMAVENREFPTVDSVPRTRELRRVVLAMNRMVGKLEQIMGDQHERAERLRRLAYVDSVTGLANEGAFRRELERLAAGGEEGGFGAVILVRVHGLEALNRARGSHAGDDLLRATAGRLSDELSGRDAMVARLAGSLFGVLVEDLARAEAERIMRALIAGLGGIATTDGTAPGVNAGLAYFAGDISVQTLLDRAEAALNNARESGVDRWHSWDETQTAGRAELVGESHWRTTLEVVIRDRSLVLAAQPVVALGTGSVFHREVFARVRLADGALIPAGRFVPISARLDLIGAIDRLVIEMTIAGMRAAAIEDPLAVNVSRRTLEEPGFVAWLDRTLAAHSTPQGRLAFEVTEQAAAARPDYVLPLADVARAHGMRFGIDHGGARDLALAYLQRLKPDYTKIEGAFIRGLEHESDRAHHLRSLVEIGRALDVVMIAAGVETEGELDVVRELGFDAAQGHLLGVPAELD